MCIHASQNAKLFQMWVSLIHVHVVIAFACMGAREGSEEEGRKKEKKTEELLKV